MSLIEGNIKMDEMNGLMEGVMIEILKISVVCEEGVMEG